MERKAYPSDVSDDEWALVAPYLMLMKEDAPRREYNIGRPALRGLCYSDVIERSGNTRIKLTTDVNENVKVIHSEI